MLRDGRVVHPASDGTYHQSLMVAFARSFRYKIFMASCDGAPHLSGMYWDKADGEAKQKQPEREMA